MENPLTDFKQKNVIVVSQILYMYRPNNIAKGKESVLVRSSSVGFSSKQQNRSKSMQIQELIRLALSNRNLVRFDVEACDYVMEECITATTSNESEMPLPANEENWRDSQNEDILFINLSTVR
jgi:hypothetical protein